MLQSHTMTQLQVEGGGLTWHFLRWGKQEAVTSPQVLYTIGMSIALTEYCLGRQKLR